MDGKFKISGGFALALALAFLVVSGTGSEAFPDKTDDCSRCHGPSLGTYYEDILSITVSKTVLAPGEEYVVGVDIVIQTDLSKKETGYAIQDAGTGDWVVWSTTAVQSHWDQTMTAPAAVGSYTYRVWGESGPATNSGKTDYDDYTIVVEASTQQQFTLSLLSGWNLVSVPLMNHGYRASTLGLQVGDLVATWDSTTQSYQQSYIVGVSPSASDFDISTGYGYWIYTAAPEALILTGEIATATQTRSITVPVGGGWSIFGLASTTTVMQASDIPTISSPPGSVLEVAGYDTSSGTYTAYIPGVPQTDFTLVPGMGYWLWTSQSVVLTYAP